MLSKTNTYRAASRQAQIVELGGLKLLLPLTQSKDVEVQRLAVHALANLSVDGEYTTYYMEYKYMLSTPCVVHRLLIHFLLCMMPPANLLMDFNVTLK